MGYQPHSLQRRILVNRSRFRLIVAGRRWGKSLLASWEALATALQGGRVWVVGLTYEQTDRILEPLWTFLGRNPQLVGQGTRRSERRIHLHGCKGGFIVGKSADHADSLVGDSLDLVILDEAPIMPQRLWEQQVRPSLSDRRGSALLIGTPRGHNWAFDLYSRARRDGEAEGDPEWYAWTAPSWSNTTVFPGGKDDPEIVKAEQDAIVAGLLPIYLQEYGASFTALEGRCYSRWDPAEHVVPDSQAAQFVVETIGGVDWGYNDPTVLLVCGRTNDGQWRVLDEFYARDLLHDQVMVEMDRLAAKWRVSRWWCDSAEPARIAACIDHGLDARPAWKERTAGVMLIAPFLGRRGGFAVAQRCRNLRREIETYVWRESKIREEPTKGNDHACVTADAMVATSRGPVRIADVAVGDTVETRSGQRPVLAAGMTSNAATVFRVELSNGTRLDATGNHPVLSASGGWIAVDSLRYGDILTTWQKPSSSTESSSDATLIPRDARCASTGRRVLRTNCAESDGYTRRSGSRRTGRYQTATTSTTLTGIRSTTTLKTSNVSALASTQSDTTPGLNHRTRSANTLKASGRLPPNGTGPRPGESGTSGTALSRGSDANRTRAIATDAERSTCRADTRAATAPTVAGRRPGVSAETTTSGGSALTAARRSSSTATTRRRTAPVSVLSVRELPGKVPVYNIEVDGAHEYVANGVVVHNCDAMRYAIATELYTGGRVARSLRIQGL